MDRNFPNLQMMKRINITGKCKEAITCHQRFKVKIDYNRPKKSGQLMIK
jgi:hypothetical protein